MPHLRPTAIAGLLLALVPAAATLTSCGFDYPTDRVNTIGAGDNDRDQSVDALGIRVLATAKGEGRLIGSLANNLEDAATLDSVASPEGQAQAASFEKVEVPGRGTVNLANIDAIELTGDFTAGDVLPLELTFSTGETASVDAPVVKACYQYTQVPTPTPSTTTEEEPAADESPAGEAAEAAADEEGHDEGHGDGEDATFNCAEDAPSPEGGH
ncbi:hypothetical protein [Nocardioides sp. J54]|uniref:hypothetical protein n=1 Tax=Nocardioides sp. J54 TaxID=935866 RepID=UPI00048F05D0|nr:hypothetical protein [Nocardioides sp. J54]